MCGSARLIYAQCPQTIVLHIALQLSPGRLIFSIDIQRMGVPIPDQIVHQWCDMENKASLETRLF